MKWKGKGGKGRPARKATAKVVPEDVGLADLAIQIRREHSEALASARGVVLHALEAGRLLHEAKAKLQHGKWSLWLKDNCKLSTRTAQRYMYLANKLPDRLKANTTRVADLTMRGALDLVTTGGPPLVRDAGILNGQTPAQQKMALRVQAGDVPLTEARALLMAYQDEVNRHIEEEDVASAKQNALLEIERLADDPNSVSLRRNLKAKLKEFAAKKRERWEDHKVAPCVDWSDRENDLNYIEEAIRLIEKAEVYLKALVRRRGPTMDRDLRIRLADACGQASRALRSDLPDGHQLPLSTPSEDGDAVARSSPLSRRCLSRATSDALYDHLRASGSRLVRLKPPRQVRQQRVGARVAPIGDRWPEGFIVTTSRLSFELRQSFLKP